MRAALWIKCLAWLVHLYTALGLLVSAGIAVAIVEASPGSFLWAFIGMWVAMIIDATDGMLARRLRVKEVLPGFDGRRLDDLTDFLTYTCLPLLLIWRAQLVPPGYGPWLLFPLLASAYGFCQVDVKTDDGFFLGFPSYWNVVALYLYFLRPAAELSVAILTVLAFLTFVPTRYLYPSQRGTPLNSLTNYLGAAWGICWGGIFVDMVGQGAPVIEAQGGARVAVLLSFVYPGYYFVVSWVISLQRWMKSGSFYRS
jgi:phosphatidylcholine synthase